MKTKLLALLLMLAMVVSVLASCGGNDGDGEGEGEGTGEGEGGGDTLVKIAADKWAAAFDVSNATVEATMTMGSNTMNIKVWSVDGDYYTENEDGAFENFPGGEEMLEAFEFFGSADVYAAVAIVAEGKYTAASLTVEGETITDVEIVLVGDKVSTIKYAADGGNATYTVTNIGTTEAPSHDRTKEYYWTAADNKSLIIEMNQDTCTSEMLSYTRRYMAGMPDNKDDVLNTRLDQLVADRNTAAYGATKLTVSYVFHEDGVYSWNKYHSPISKAIAEPNADTPDIFCGFAYDLANNSAKGDFVNLMGTTRGEGNNYFTFNEDNYNADYDDEGYFYELMTSISPVDDKMYVYASNYTIDVIRAIYCIPVSINLLETLQLNKLADADGDMNYKWDADEDGKWSVDDFYDIVFTNNFTYDVLGAMGGAAYVNTSGGANANYGDTLGFAFDTGMGLPAAGIIYANDIELFQKSYDAEGNPVFTTPATNEAFLTLVNEFGAVFNVTGNIINGDFKLVEGASKVMYAIRTRFSEDKILFGGVINIGTLDYAEYQEMEGGFGIVPIPLVDNTKQYVSAIHNLARVMGIAKSTTDFEQASAFLDYQALNSDEVMSTYYSLLQYDTVGGEQYNIAVLNTLRNSLGDNKNQYLENQVRNQTEITAKVTVDAWGGFFRRTSFDAEELRSKYEGCVANKNTALAMLVEIYQGFEN